MTHTGFTLCSLCPLWPHQSKVELQSELNHARIARRCDRAEGRVADHSVRVPERRRVRQVENLRSEFEIPDLAEIRPLDKCDVRRAVTGPRTGLREAFPSVNCGATAKADVSNQRSVVRWSEGKVGLRRMFGR